MSDYNCDDCHDDCEMIVNSLCRKGMVEDCKAKNKIIEQLKAEIKCLREIIEEAVSQHHRVASNTIVDGIIRKYEALKGG